MIHISSNRNQNLQYSLNTFYHHINEMKKGTIFWSIGYCGQYPSCRTIDNAFIFNRILGYNSVLFDDIDQK